MAEIPPMDPYNSFLRELAIENGLAEADQIDMAIKMTRLKKTPLFDLLVEQGVFQKEQEAEIVEMWEEMQHEAHLDEEEPVHNTDIEDEHLRGDLEDHFEDDDDPEDPFDKPDAFKRDDTPQEVEIEKGPTLSVSTEVTEDEPAESEVGDITITSSTPALLSGKLQTMKEYLAFAREAGASDLHMPTGGRPHLRQEGIMKPLLDQLMPAKEVEELVRGCLSEDLWNKLQKDQALECCLKIEDQGRYRCTVVKQRMGLSASFRVVSNRIRSLDELKLPKEVARLTEYHQGLILVAGPNGCGKTTTVAAMIELVNLTRDEHIITIEDPIEYLYTCKKAHINQREVGSHTKEFANALRAALREDPDVMLIGELRDKETISLAITAAETGHLVIGTLHTTSAAGTIDRLLDVFPPEEQGQIRSMISESVKGIICQQLLPRSDNKGREIALEILYTTPAMGAMIRDRKLHQLPTVIQTGKKVGMISMEQSLEELVKRKVISGEEAYWAANDKERFNDYKPTFRKK